MRVYKKGEYVVFEKKGRVFAYPSETVHFSYDEESCYAIFTTLFKENYEIKDLLKLRNENGGLVGDSLDVILDYLLENEII